VGLSKAKNESDSVDSEVRAILDAGAGIDAAPWVYAEFTGADLGDERLNKRLVKTAGFLGASPVSPINLACLDWNSTKAAYRFFDNEKADADKIRAPHIAAARQRMIAASDEGQKVLLAASDTAFIAYAHPNVTGIGPIGKDNDEGRGLVMHSVLVMTTGGTPLAVLHQNIWARDEEVPNETRQEKIERLQQTPLEEKESWKWERASEDLLRHTPPGVKVVELDDREGDFFEHLVGQQKRKIWYVIRARVDRRLVEEDNEGHARMREVLEAAEVLGTMEVKVQGNGDRKTRTATVEIKVATVTIPQPQRRGRAKDPTLPDEITIKLVSATEISTPPEGEEAISWVLLTNMLVSNFDAAREKVLWYSKRFVIETFHKVLKSGLRVEACRLETAARLTRHLTVCSVIAVRMMNVAYLSRERPDLPATEVFANEELDALHVQLREGPPPRRPPTLKEAVRMVVKLGGNLDRKRDKPGMTVMWRGWRKMYGAVRLMRRLQMAGMLNAA
jgi:hypothetical protein